MVSHSCICLSDYFSRPAFRATAKSLPGIRPCTKRFFLVKKAGIQLNILSEPADPNGFFPRRQANGFPWKRGSLPIGKEIRGLAKQAAF
jgi:hypothetical protein